MIRYQSTPHGLAVIARRRFKGLITGPVQEWHYVTTYRHNYAAKVGDLFELGPV